LEVVDRDSSVGINGSVHSEAEDIFHRRIRGFDRECSEERLILFQGSLESQTGDFLGRGVKLAVVISVEFMIKNPLGLIDFGDILSDTGSDQSVLEPAIRTFNLASGLRRKGMNNLDIAVLQNLFPLRGGFIGQKMMFSPEGVSSLDESKDARGVHIGG